VDGNLRERVISELLALPLADNLRARALLPDGNYRPVAAAGPTPARRSQFEFIALAGGGGRPVTKSPRAKGKYPRVTVARRPF
jgi:hypothetical protein